MTTLATHAPRVTRPARSFWIRALNWLIARDAQFRERKALEQLDAHLLRDIGLEPDDVHREVVRPIWDAPKVMRRS
ncbi:MAG: DUF1127 domain-containing protein [Pseudomonadota bacterium]